MAPATPATLPILQKDEQAEENFAAIPFGPKHIRSVHACINFSTLACRTWECVKIGIAPNVATLRFLARLRSAMLGKWRATLCGRNP
jgi:hypothetical protein